ncbi:helix-turn-helix domain-containing protein [Saccharococcus caldoxylosilyticus]|jgi:transcriptional regulator with XRE-family HTH domain|uniref:Putative Xre family DNA-binding protein n=1 Tax=Parageobacillus caldoxylosilyticus NBRC 107762 TaxID=1220594 RepID=A0A023DDC8_9BACL|nr:helix-turn-helix domain-containing protein [Parageobacillus caldoxylosilyticus]MBB3852597.1 transcriptional regulator with XRE-family HTH domain [Parageobacillus caldoxylosilyticus]GAJ39318.1 putative Xre family DNA-binding protein [Parageobacillus caldoxylosilyticus NBRC 107762]
MMDLGERLKYLRKQQHWTQEQLAQYLNISRSQISKWENGDLLPDVQSLQKLSNLYNVSIDFLIGRDSSKKELLREVRRWYQTDDISEKTLDIINYLKQNPNIEEAIYSLAQLPNKKRKHAEVMISTIIKEFSDAIK